MAEGQDYFPLSVNYQEKYYAAGKIPGGYFKARPTEAETLISRLIDRPIRPLFPSGFIDEVRKYYLRYYRMMVKTNQIFCPIVPLQRL